jgi:hypothetical protein
MSSKKASKASKDAKAPTKQEKPNEPRPQSLLTKFFKVLEDNGKPYYNFLFEKEAAERKKRQEEEMKR